MRLQILVEENIEAEYLEAHISVFVAPLVTSSDLRFMSNTRFDYDVLDSIHDFLEIDTVPPEPLLQLK